MQLAWVVGEEQGEAAPVQNVEGSVHVVCPVSTMLGSHVGRLHGCGHP